MTQKVKTYNTYAKIKIWAVGICFLDCQCLLRSNELYSGWHREFWEEQQRDELYGFDCHTLLIPPTISSKARSQRRSREIMFVKVFNNKVEV